MIPLNRTTILLDKVVPTIALGPGLPPIQFSKALDNLPFPVKRVSRSVPSRFTILTSDVGYKLIDHSRPGTKPFFFGLGSITWLTDSIATGITHFLALDATTGGSTSTKKKSSPPSYSCRCMGWATQEQIDAKTFGALDEEVVTPSPAPPEPQ